MALWPYNVAVQQIHAGDASTDEPASGLCLARSSYRMLAATGRRPCRMFVGDSRSKKV